MLTRRAIVAGFALSSIYQFFLLISRPLQCNPPRLNVAFLCVPRDKLSLVSIAFLIGFCRFSVLRFFAASRIPKIPWDTVGSDSPSSSIGISLSFCNFDPYSKSTQSGQYDRGKTNKCLFTQLLPPSSPSSFRSFPCSACVSRWRTSASSSSSSRIPNDFSFFFFSFSSSLRQLSITFPATRRRA